MKVRFYCDIMPGTWPRYELFAQTLPSVKSEGIRRFAFDVEIPDQVLAGVDFVSPEPVKVEEVNGIGYKK